MPKNFTQKERRNLLSALGLGRVNTIGAQQLAIALGYPRGGNQVKLRSLIKECIEIDGDLIGAAVGRPAGFFKINSLIELEHYIDSLEGRTRSNNERRNALIKNWNSAQTLLTTRRILTIR